MMRKAIISSLLAVLLCGCAYHFGNALPESQRRVAVDAVINQTEEVSLGTMTRDALLNRLSQTPGISLAATDGSDAGLTVTVTLKTLEQSNLARALTREKKDRDKDADAYQAVLYRITIEADWIAVPANEGEAVRKGTAVATADVPLMPDKETAMRSALRQIAMDLAARVASDVTD